MSNQHKTLGTISLIFGIVSLVLFCIPFFSVFLAATGVILGTLGTIQVSKTNEPKGTQISGLIISILALLIGIAYNLTLFLWLPDKDDWFDTHNPDDYDPYYDEQFYDPYEVDTNLTDVDSLLLDEAAINDLDNTNDDFDNGPGPAPN